MTANARAGDIRRRLFALVGEFKDLHQAIAFHRYGKAARDAAGQADAAACELAALHDKISGPSPEWDLFTDEARDEKDQEYRFELGKDGVADDFADTLEELREKAGLTKADLAEKSGLSRQTIHSLETGTFRPGWDAVQKLAAALGVSTDAFRDR